jgi:Fic-DOC domain mobile mystery protein B
LLRRSPTTAQLLDDTYLRGLHRAMFGKVWKWAGQYRRIETNIGIEPNEIPVAVRSLVDDAKGWVEYSVYEADELCIQFHHRLVAIRPFANGNGRHGRVAADYLVLALDRERFTWGSDLEVDTDELRTRYRRALERADGGEIADLIAFARS